MCLQVGVRGEAAPFGLSATVGAGTCACGRDGAEDPGAAFDEAASARERDHEPPIEQQAKPDATHLRPHRLSHSHLRAQ